MALDTAELWKLEEKSHSLWGALGALYLEHVKQGAAFGPDVSRDSVGTFVVNLRTLARAATRLADALAKKYGING